MMQSKFKNSGYERFQVEKKVDMGPKKEAGYGPGSDQASSSGSPQKKAGSPKNNPGGALVSPQEKTFETIKAWVDRNRAAIKDRNEQKERFDQLGCINPERWKGGRQSPTTPTAFYSHAALRKQQRKQAAEDARKEMESESHRLFQDLHEQLHSLQLGGH